VVASLAGVVHVAGSVSAAVTPSTAHGEHFLFELAVDRTFCIDEAPGNAQGRAVTLSACGTADTERWALTENADGTNAFIDSQGMCLDTTGRKIGDGIALKVFDCRFNDHERFSYTALGLVQVKSTDACLRVPGAANGTAVSLAKCDSTSTGEVFKLAH
jgi:hypothetical protein